MYINRKNISLLSSKSLKYSHKTVKFHLPLTQNTTKMLGICMCGPPRVVHYGPSCPLRAELFGIYGPRYPLRSCLLWADCLLRAELSGNLNFDPRVHDRSVNIANSEMSKSFLNMPVIWIGLILKILKS